MADQPAWEMAADGIVLPVQAQPGSRRNGLSGIRDGRLLVAVTQAPEKGKANKAIVEVLADSFQIKRRQITLLSGETSSHKRFLIREYNFAELQQRLSLALVGR